MSCKNILFVQDYEFFGGPQKLSWPKNPSFVSSPISRGIRRLETRHPLPATAILECTTHCITTSLTPSSSSAKATHLHAGAQEVVIVLLVVLVGKLAVGPGLTLAALAAHWQGA